jgi:hypothetical protein
VFIDGGWRHCRRRPHGANWANVYLALDDNPPLSRMYELVGLVIRILLQRHVVDELSKDIYRDRVTRGRYTEVTNTYVRVWGALGW